MQEKCPVNSYQLKGLCQPCPEGTYQDRPGQTECWPCSKRPSNSTHHYNVRCKRRTKEFAGHHPALAVLLANKHLIRNKSLSYKSGKVNIRPILSKKLGSIAPVSLSFKHHLKINDYPSKYSKKSSKKPFTSKSRRNLADYYPATGTTSSLKQKKSNFTDGALSEDDPCWPNPCLAGGTCFRTSRFDDNNNLVQNFKCACRPGATGEVSDHSFYCSLLEFRFRPVIQLSLMDYNGVLCVLGVHCETPYCPALYCFNGGTCVINHQRFGPGPESRELVSCECPSGFTGRRCEHRRRRLASESHKIRHHRRRQQQLKAV